jgi:RNA polymerase sigma-70 factor (ECF subfamily)
MTPPQEKILIRKLKGGSVTAFEKLFDYYYPKLVNFSDNFLQDIQESENIAQEVFIQIWELRKNLNEEYSFNSYLFKISKNRILNHLRKRVNQRKYIDFILTKEQSDSNTVLEQIHFNELQNHIELQISRMPARRREIFNLSRREGLTYKEIARNLNISENTVDTQIRNALNDLKRLLIKLYPTLAP